MMTIINKIDEKNPDNNRTIDTETKMVVRLDGFDIRDRDCFFTLSDGDTDISITARKGWKTDDENKRRDVCYSMDHVETFGVAKRKNYLSNIKEFLSTHGDNFKSWERTKQYSETTKVEVRTLVTEKLANWENRND
ncbi:MAG: hypothetical protein GY748_10000 [Planctomycetaceae bacterium]|nr:hypothetical protein [Planctomycetaceae bacterium]